MSAPAESAGGPGPGDQATTIDAAGRWDRYVDLAPYARGGIGEVFRGADPELHRTVAVKRLREQHVGNAQSRQRFLLEAEVTARLEHPGVVPVYGLLGDRECPAYAMRFVEGPTFAEAIKEHHAGAPNPMGLRRLLDVFLRVCQTVGYAHSRGIIHRDLKPANVILGPYGETLVVDWGLAKVLGRDEIPGGATGETSTPGSSEQTAMGSALGTPAYMSPEQAAGRWDVVAQPTDIYSLGAILYALLTGRAPLEEGNWPQLQQKIQRGDFPRPRQVKRDVPRPLEAISLKAMAPEPSDRYASANALAADVEHWLADEPVSACPERLPTRVRRWAKRNRMLVGAGLFLLVAIVIGLSIGAALLERARLETDQQRHAAVIAQGKAEAINRFLIDDLLKQADPATNPAGDRLTVRQLLDLATSRLDARTELAGQPEVEAEVRGVMGRAYENLGAHEQASRHYRRAWGLLASVHGATHASTLKARNDYVYVVVDADLSPEGPALARELYAACEAALGAEHLQTARALGILGRVLDAAGDTVEAERALQKSSRLLQASLGPDNHLSLDTDNSLAGLYWRSGQAEKAEPIMRSIVERRRRGARDPDLSLAIGNYGYILLALGRFAEAGAAAEEAVEVGTRSVGPTALGTLSARSLRGYVHEAQGRWSEAERDFVAVLADRRRLLPPTAANVKRSLGHLARLYAKRERWSDAAPYLADLLLAQSPDPARKRDELAQALAAALSGDADPAAAEPLLKQCWDCGKAILAQGDWLRPELASRYGDCLRRRGKYADAEPLLVAAASDVAKAIAPPPWSVPAARRRVADLYDAWGKPAEAAKWR